MDGEFIENVYEAQVNSSGFTKESYIEIMTGLSASELYRSSLNAVNLVTDQELYQLASLLEKSTNIDFIKKLKTYNKINVNLDHDELYAVRIK